MRSGFKMDTKMITVGKEQKYDADESVTKIVAASVCCEYINKGKMQWPQVLGRHLLWLILHSFASSWQCFFPTGFRSWIHRQCVKWSKRVDQRPLGILVFSKLESAQKLFSHESCHTCVWATFHYSCIEASRLPSFFRFVLRGCAAAPLS